MSRIVRLPPEIANKIAAGEVVERPASLAKELLENALDAGARRIEIVFDGGGLDRIRVSDDGSGIPADEVELAFERHATSKLVRAEDLGEIATLGFRGEALASIAAVSRVEMTTAAVGATSGTRIRLEGGRVIAVERAARAQGTTIEVASLFYNTPARRKFLKTPPTEARVLTRLAGFVSLGAPGVGFTIVRDGRTVLDLPPAGTFRERVAALLGRAVAERMIDVRGERDGVRVSGLVSLVEFTRTRAEHQLLLVNGRVVNDPSLAHAVAAGIGGALPSGRYPIFALAVEVDPSRVDVNVHPTKREVRFLEKDRVYGAVREHVARGAAAKSFDDAGRILSLDRSRPGAGTPGRAAAIRFGLPDDVPPATGLGPDRGGIARTSRRGSAPGAGGSSAAPGALPFAPVDTDETASAEEQDETANDATSDGVRRLRLAGELWGAYLVVEDGERLLLIDQHAAHERVLYDELLRRQNHGGAPSLAQGLLVPLSIELGPGQDPAEAAELLHTLGFEAREGGPGSVFVEAIPAGLSRWGGGEFLLEFFASPEAAKAGVEKRLDALAKSYSCKAAVKFGQRLHPEEIRHLLDALAVTDVPRLCPHGRPIYLALARDAIDAKFERT